MTTGEKIVKLRKQAGLSQEAFSEKLNISRQAVSKWENGTATPTNENLARIARIFGVQASSLLDDEDLIFNTADTIPQKEFTVEKAKNNVTNIFQSAAIIVLALAVIVQGISIGRLKSEINIISAQAADANRLQRELDSLRSYVYSLPAKYTENSKDFTDYQYGCTNYDYKTNCATLQFSVVPTNYTAYTQAKIVVKGSSETYSADAVLENDIFTATLDVYCEDNLSVYLYLTDNGQTRSFLLDYLPDPADNYRLGLTQSNFEGNMEIHTGELMIKGSYDVTVDYSVRENIEKSVYPVKAVLEIYAGKQLIKEVPYESIMEFDFIGEAKSYLDGTAEQHVATSVNFGQWMDITVTDENIKPGSEISFILRVHDNNGAEYTCNTDMFTHTV